MSTRQTSITPAQLQMLSYLQGQIGSAGTLSIGAQVDATGKRIVNIQESTRPNMQPTFWGYIPANPSIPEEKDKTNLWVRQDEYDVLTYSSQRQQTGVKRYVRTATVDLGFPEPPTEQEPGFNKPIYDLNRQKTGSQFFSYAGEEKKKNVYFWSSQGYPELSDYQTPILGPDEYVKKPVVNLDKTLSFLIGSRAADKQLTLDTEFWRSQGHPEYAGKYAPFDPEGRSIANIEENEGKLTVFFTNESNAPSPQIEGFMPPSIHFGEGQTSYGESGVSQAQINEMVHGFNVLPIAKKLSLLQTQMPDVYKGLPPSKDLTDINFDAVTQSFNLTVKKGVSGVDGYWRKAAGLTVYENPVIPEGWSIVGVKEEPFVGPLKAGQERPTNLVYTLAPLTAPAATVAKEKFRPLSGDWLQSWGPSAQELGVPLGATITDMKLTSEGLIISYLPEPKMIKGMSGSLFGASLAKWNPATGELEEQIGYDPETNEPVFAEVIQSSWGDVASGKAALSPAESRAVLGMTLVNIVALPFAAPVLAFFNVGAVATAQIIKGKKWLTPEEAIGAASIGTLVGLTTMQIGSFVNQKYVQPRISESLTKSYLEQIKINENVLSGKIEGTTQTWKPTVIQRLEMKITGAQPSSFARGISSFSSPSDAVYSLKMMEAESANFDLGFSPSSSYLGINKGVTPVAEFKLAANLPLKWGLGSTLYYAKTLYDLQEKNNLIWEQQEARKFGTTPSNAQLEKGIPRDILEYNYQGDIQASPWQIKSVPKKPFVESPQVFTDRTVLTKLFKIYPQTLTKETLGAYLENTRLMEQRYGYNMLSSSPRAFNAESAVLMSRVPLSSLLKKLTVKPQTTVLYSSPNLSSFRLSTALQIPQQQRRTQHEEEETVFAVYPANGLSTPVSTISLVAKQIVGTNTVTGTTQKINLNTKQPTTIIGVTQIPQQNQFSITTPISTQKLKQSPITIPTLTPIQTPKQKPIMTPIQNPITMPIQNPITTPKQVPVTVAAQIQKTVSTQIQKPVPMNILEIPVPLHIPVPHLIPVPLPFKFINPTKNQDKKGLYGLWFERTHPVKTYSAMLKTFGIGDADKTQQKTVTVNNTALFKQFNLGSGGKPKGKAGTVNIQAIQKSYGVSSKKKHKR